MLAACCIVQARPLTIIIVTSKDSAETSYAAFLQEIFLDNAEVLIDDNRYHESLRDIEKQELLAADLVIVSSANSGGDYNDDSAFWAALPVPILSHSISVCRSNSQANWDWFAGGQTTVPISSFEPVEPDDALFDGIDLTGGTIPFFDPPLDVAVSNAPYAGYGTPLAVEGAGRPAIVRFDGSEPAYYDGSLYAPGGAPRIFFALPDEPETFFARAAPAAKQLLRNAVTSLLAECWLPGDIDCDRDVDLQDFCALSAQWLDTTLPLSADIAPDTQVNLDDFAVLAMFWLEGFDTTPPLPDPFDWTTPPAIQDGGFIQMKAKKANDNLHGVQYYFECLETGLYSSGWQYDRLHTPANVPLATDLSFRVKARDTSSRFNETGFSSIQSVRTDGLFYYSADASAAVALDGHRFIMADDENSFLNVYDWNLPASDPIMQTDVSAAIETDPVHPEPDIEGATWYNGRVFWITSHGRSREGDYWPSRYRFFATTIAPDGTATVDGVYSGLIDHLIQYDRIHNLGLEAAIGTVSDHIDPATIADLAPKVNGLNIEGLCTTADGSKMLIGFRNPRPVIDGKVMALVIPLVNPEAVVLNGAAPILEPPLFIDFNGLGIRSMEYSPAIGKYLLVAGSHRGGESEPVQYLYHYDLTKEDKNKLATFTDLTPEAILLFPDGNEIHLLSDDGTRLIDTPEGQVTNKLLPIPQRSYRTRTIKP
jgi:hypothetical protein